MSHIELDLLAYLDGELSPADVQSVEAHVAGCPACAAELVEFQRLRAGLSTVVPVVYDSVHLPTAAEARIRSALAAERARQDRPGARQAGLWAGLLAAFRPLSKAAIPLVVVFFLGMALNAYRLPVQNAAQQTLVLGQDTLAPGSQAALRVVVNNTADNQPVANANVAVQMRQAGLARTLFDGQTDATGSVPVQFQVPADWEGSAELVVATESDLGQDEVVAPIQLQRTYRLLLSSDKPVYQPGETIHLRTLALGAVDSQPASGAVALLEVFDSAGQQLLSQQQQSSEFGIAATDLPLAPDAPLGQYQLRATLGDTVSELSVMLGEAPLPNFQVDVAASAPFYLPGDTVDGQVNASYFFGKPVAGGQINLRLVGLRVGQDPAAGEERLFVQELRGETGADGSFPFQFEIPDLADDTFGPSNIVELNLEATVTDAAGETQFGWQGLTVAAEPILIAVTPEDGTLHTGVENILYVLTSYPDGRPAPATLQVQIGSGAVIEQAANEFGLAEVRYTPRAGAEGDRAVTVTATDAAGLSGATSVVLPLDDALETLLLRTDRALYQVGDTLLVEAIATGSGPVVFLDVLKGGQTLLTQSALVESGKATLAVDLTPDLAGALELNAYQITGDDNILRDTRVALVDAPEDIQVQLAAGQAEYRPGQQAEISVHTTAGGEDVQTAVGLAVVNEAVYSQRQYQPGFTRAFFLLDQALQASGVTAPDAAQTVDDELMRLRAAQQLTAKASWAAYSGRQYSLTAQSINQASLEADPARKRAFGLVSQGISLALLAASLLAAAIILVGLRRSGVLGQALGRLLLTLLVLAVAGAGLILLTQTVVDDLSAQGVWLLLALAGGLWLALLIALLVYGWRRRDQRIQYVALLLLAYVALLALLAFAAGQGATLAPAWLAALAVSFGLLLVALLLFGWGLRREGQQRAGLGVLLLALLVMPLVVTLNAVDFRGADLIQRVAGPPVYSLCNGLLAGCAAPPAPTPQPAMPESAAGSASAPAAAQAPLAAPEEAAAPQAEQQALSLGEEPAGAELATEAVAPAAAVPEEAAAAAAPALDLPPAPGPEAGAAEARVLGTVTPTLTFDLSALDVMTTEIEAEMPTLSAAAALSATLFMTETATITPTLVITATPTITPAITATLTPTLTAREAVIAAQAQGAGETATPEPTATPTATWTPEPTATPQPTPTAEPSATPEAAPTATPQPESTAAPQPEATATTTAEPTAEAPSAEALAAPAAAKAGVPVEIPLESLPIIRERFPQTLYWNPEIVTDDAGRLAVSIPTGDSITTWRINAVAVDRRGRLGSASAPLVVFQPLFTRTNLPARMAVGEQFDGQIQIFNYSRQAQPVRLSVQASAGVQVEPDVQSLTIPANDVVVVSLNVRAVSPGQQTLIINLIGDGIQDAQQMTILVQ